MSSDVLICTAVLHIGKHAPAPAPARAQAHTLTRRAKSGVGMVADMYQCSVHRAHGITR